MQCNLYRLYDIGGFRNGGLPKQGFPKRGVFKTGVLFVIDMSVEFDADTGCVDRNFVGVWNDKVAM